MSKYALIVAGGKGLRFGSDLPKQFMALKTMPVLMHSISTFYKYDNACKIIVCLPKEHIVMWQTLCEKYQFTIAHQVISGGETRFNTVKNGLDSIPEKDGLVAVHDGVRPLLSLELISKLFEEANKHKSAVPAIALTDSIRLVVNNENKSVDRSLYKAIQTPQCFCLNTLKQAYNQPYNNSFTDDASVFETLGYKIHLIEGDRKNIKITTAEDLAIAVAILKL